MEKEGIILFLFSTAVYIRKLVSMTVEREGGERKGSRTLFASNWESWELRQMQRDKLEDKRIRWIVAERSNKRWIKMDTLRE